MGIIVLILIVAIFVSLSSSHRFMMKADTSTNMVKALTWRVGLSVVLFVFLMMGFWLDWFQPHQSNF